MAGPFVSVPITLSDLERPDVKNQIFQTDLNNAGLVSHVVAFAQMQRRGLSVTAVFLVIITENLPMHSTRTINGLFSQWY